MIRLVLIEDEEVFRLGITTAIQQQPDMEMVANASTGEQGINIVKQWEPDVVLVDIGLPDISGVEVIKQIKIYRSNTKVVVLSCNSSQEIVNAAIGSGADSYILKKNNISLILEAIRTTYNNKSLFDSEIIKRGLLNLLHKPKIKGKIFDDHLTEREINVLSLIAAGLSNKEIGQKLFIGENTVKNHARNIYSKLGVDNRINAILKASELGYISNTVTQVS
jgi:DNA-binding NarL/FixJ family response regulator